MKPSEDKNTTLGQRVVAHVIGHWYPVDTGEKQEFADALAVIADWILRGHTTADVVHRVVDAAAAIRARGQEDQP